MTAKTTAKITEALDTANELLRNSTFKQCAIVITDTDVYIEPSLVNDSDQLAMLIDFTMPHHKQLHYATTIYPTEEQTND